MLCKTLNCRVGLVGLVAVLLSPVAAAAGDSFDLKPKFPTGRRQYTELSVEAVQVIKGPAVPGGQMDIKIKQVTGVMETVESSSKKGAKIVLSYDRRGMAFEHPMTGKLHYDSDLPSEDDAPYIKQMFVPIMGMSLTMELDESGKVTSFSGMDAVLKKVEASSAGNPFFSQMKSSLTNDAAKLIWGENRWIVLPDHPVKPGDTWTCRSVNDVPQFGTLVSDYNCKLDRIAQTDGRKLAIIAYTGKITQTAVEGDPTLPGGMPLKIKEGTFTGTANFDIAAGQIVDQLRETQMALEMPSLGDDDAPAMQMTTSTRETSIVRSPTEREKTKQENLAKARAKMAEVKKAEAGKADSKKAKTDSE